VELLHEGPAEKFPLLQQVLAALNRQSGPSRTPKKKKILQASCWLDHLKNMS
jgi:hypothetical protein